MLCITANALWLANCLPEFARFHRATTRVREEQELILRRLLRANAGTEFGLRHGFSGIRSVREYQERVPLLTYDEYRAWIDRLADGSTNVLTRERVRVLEPTSGSAGATKLVPYTPSLQREFQRGIRAWIADLFRHHPELMSGQAYWSVSPATASTRGPSGGIPIGFEDDSFYVGGWQRRLVQAVMAVPAAVRRISDIERFRYVTLLYLIRSPNLRLISIWSPTFLSLLVDHLPAWSDALAHDLASDTRRADVLCAALRAQTPGERHAILWPNLTMISCWTDANAAAPAARLAGLFPQARIQGKGLIATEGFISFPLISHHGSALAVRSHFLEFAPVQSPEQRYVSVPRLAHELEQGQQYTVILSSGGGLYRYHLHDVIEVVGHLRQCPLIRFVGRQAHMSDWFGEKLSEAYVARILRQECESVGVTPRFAMVACDTTLEPAAYVLYIDARDRDEVFLRLAAAIEAELRRSFHYNYARLLGQLGPLRIFRAEGADEAYLLAAVRAGQRAGDVKPLALDRRNGWSQVFGGRFVGDAARSHT
jgi:hypothetical protein